MNDYVHIEAADLCRPNARFTQERQGYQVLTPFGKLGYSRFLRFSCPMTAAVLELYPALMAACVAFKSRRYSRTKAACFGVNPVVARRAVREGVMRAVVYLAVCFAVFLERPIVLGSGSGAGGQSVARTGGQRPTRPLQHTRPMHPTGSRTSA